MSELQNKPVLSLDGKDLGKIIDIIVSDDGKIEKLVVERYKFIISLFTSKDEIEVSWNNIVRIGEDVILVSFG